MNASAERIRALNDAFRTSFVGGRVMLSAGVAALLSDVQAIALRRVVTFSTFTADNDPHGEHDFGNFEVGGRHYFWKIDYYDPDLEFGSEYPSAPEKTTLVLTIMFAEEY